MLERWQAPASVLSRTYACLGLTRSSQEQLAQLNFFKLKDIVTGGLGRGEGGRTQIVSGTS